MFTTTTTIFLLALGILSKPTYAQSLSDAPSSSFVSASAAPTMSSQFPDLAPYSICVTTCLTNAVAATNCTSITDVNCYCSSSNISIFTNEITACLSGLQSCTQTDSSSLKDLANRFCSLSSPISHSLSASLSASQSHSQAIVSLSFPNSATTTVIPLTPPSPSQIPSSTIHSSSGGSFSIQPVPTQSGNAACRASLPVFDIPSLQFSLAVLLSILATPWFI